MGESEVGAHDFIGRPNGIVPAVITRQLTLTQPWTSYAGFLQRAVDAPCLRLDRHS